MPVIKFRISINLDLIYVESVFVSSGVGCVTHRPTTLIEEIVKGAQKRVPNRNQNLQQGPFHIISNK